jgi:microcin C transport system permease protein
MTTYLLRRLLLMIPTLLGITFLVFMLVALAPGGIGAAVQAQAGGAFTANTAVAIEAARLEDRYGLNDPKIVQYFRWLGRISPIKFGQRDQVLPSGEVIRAPKPIPEPALWRWFGDTLPVTDAGPAPAPAASEEERTQQYRGLSRQYSEARFAAVGANRLFDARATAYAKAAGIPGGVTGQNRANFDVIAQTPPDKSLAAWKDLETAGKRAVEAYSKGAGVRAKFKAYFDAVPFPEAGLAIVPGVVSLAPPDFGVAYSNYRPVLDQILERLPVTIMLNLVAIPIIYIVAIPSGVLAAVRRGSMFDVGLGSIYIGLYSFPIVLAGVLCVGFLASKQYLGLFPVAGLSAQDAATYTFLPTYEAIPSAAGASTPSYVFHPGWLLDRMWHMGLPVLCLVYGGFAILSKQTRAAMLENLNSDYVRTAKAKGVAGNDVVFHHVLRNSLLPLITIFVTVFPLMLAGSVVVEHIFTIEGMGTLLLDAINNRDLEVILANTVMIAVVNLTALLLADVLYAIADPRITYD